MRQQPALHLLPFLGLLFPAILAGTTIDDTDVNSFKFTPDGGDGISTNAWRDQDCGASCTVRPDLNQVFNHTYRLADVGPNRWVYFDLTFEGTGVEIYFILPNGGSRNTKAYFVLDGMNDGEPFIHLDDRSKNIYYNQKVYSKAGLPYSKHTLRGGFPDGNNETQRYLLAVDYAVVTTESPSADLPSSVSPSSATPGSATPGSAVPGSATPGSASPNPTSQSHTSSNSAMPSAAMPANSVPGTGSPSTKSPDTSNINNIAGGSSESSDSHKIANIVGGSVGGIIAVALLVLAILQAKPLFYILASLGFFLFGWWLFGRRRLNFYVDRDVGQIQITLFLSPDSVLQDLPEVGRESLLAWQVLDIGHSCRDFNIICPCILHTGDTKFGFGTVDDLGKQIRSPEYAPAPAIWTEGQWESHNDHTLADPVASVTGEPMSIVLGTFEDGKNDKIFKPFLLVKEGRGSFYL
ncbi:hypothetical protein DL96DRAFT_748589 [Flagelloscypha sp. PMI_526]|nr:hypothetical protein DL96DRAFT_748589 [Flagelloscypha sp. PMI_526]